MVAAHTEQVRQPGRVLPGKPRRLLDADPRGDPHEPRRVQRPRHADVDGQVHAAPAEPADPTGDRLGAEADLADDVGREAALVPHRLDGDVVVDEGMALGVAGDADLLELVTRLGHRRQQVERALEPAGRLLDVARDDEDLADAAVAQPLHDVLEVDLVGDQPGREVGDHATALGGQPLGDRERAGDPPGRRRRHGHRDVAGDVLGDRVRDAVEGKDLVPGSPQGRNDGLRLRCPHGDAPATPFSDAVQRRRHGASPGCAFKPVVATAATSKALRRSGTSRPGGRRRKGGRRPWWRARAPGAAPGRGRGASARTCPLATSAGGGRGHSPG